LEDVACIELSMEIVVLFSVKGVVGGIVIVTFAPD
jgi:hypothetical protein